MTTETQQNSNNASQTAQQSTDQQSAQTQTGAENQTQQTSSASTTTDLGTDEASSTKTTQSSDTDLGADDTATTTEEQNPFAEFHGLPESGTYEAFQLPDGAEADPQLTESFSGIAKKLGLSQKAAQELVNYKTELDNKTVENWVSHKEELRKQAKADPVIGGANYDAAVQAGRKSIAGFMGNDAQAFRQMLNHYGVGAHPLMIRYMAAVGKAMGETSTVEAGGGSGTTKDVPLHELMYKDSK